MVGQNLLCLLAFLAFSSLTSPAHGSPLEIMAAPNLLRVGSTENVFVEVQDCELQNDISVEITVMNHPTKATRLASTYVTLTSSNKCQAFGQIMIPPGHFSKDPTMKQYVYLQAQFPDRLLEKVVLVSFQSGYIFIQTDKTLYTPSSRVLYRLFAVKPGMEPVESATEIFTEIVTPDGIIVPDNIISLRSGIYSGQYLLGEIVVPGVWKLVAKFQSNPQQSYSAEFEVKEYVLPSFEVKITPQSSFFYVDDQELTINIKATYLFGEEVDGTAYVVFGITHEGQKRSLPRSLQTVSVDRGNGQVTLKKEHITETFPNILELVGGSIYVTVSVLTETGGEMVEATLRGIQIVTSPYTIHFKGTPKYFKPVMSFDVAIEVVNPDETPASRIPVVVEPGPVNGLTVENGMAKLTINTEARKMKCAAPSRRKRARTIRDITTSLGEEDDNSFMDSNEIVSRTQFPESWLWQDIKLPACSPHQPNCDTTSLVTTVPLQDSITTWQFIGISLSATQGICVGDPLEVIVRKNFFIDLRLPYAAVRGEQIEIKAILHNYIPEAID
uniref:complement C3-like n=1 Tax=Monopterus albus TaxID=43700 RepID=UPI0009B4E9BC